MPSCSLPPKNPRCGSISTRHSCERPVSWARGLPLAAASPAGAAVRATAAVQGRWDWVWSNKGQITCQRFTFCIEAETSLTSPEEKWIIFSLFIIPGIFFLFSLPSPFNWTHVCNAHVIGNAPEKRLVTLFSNIWEKEEGAIVGLSNLESSFSVPSRHARAHASKFPGHVGRYTWYFASSDAVTSSRAAVRKVRTGGFLTRC